ncbi:MAG: type II toxin-antitoxin system RelB/DinJ family antitoxin [Defluviitaleaceae bacterium]|nr:type II toxin-antitoxin system RelB/DinJ family antitoxin [Defluviitaleaceae bacterium]
MAQAMVNFRMDENLKKSMEQTCKDMGLSMTSAFTIFATKVAREKRIPFEISAVQLTENGYTPEFEAEILAEAEKCYAAVANGTAKLYKNAEELFADLDAEDDDE